MKRLAGALAGLAFGGTLIGAAVDAEQKCRPRAGMDELPLYIWLLDGEEYGQLRQGQEWPIPLEEVASMDFLCEDRIPAGYDARVRAGVASVWSKAAIGSLFEAHLTDLAAAQAAFHQANGRYATDPAELGFWKGRHRVSLVVKPTENGWQASAFQNGLDLICRIAAGDEKPSCGPIHGEGGR